jgi:hypothetical protein
LPVHNPPLSLLRSNFGTREVSASDYSDWPLICYRLVERLPKSF